MGLLPFCYEENQSCRRGWLSIPMCWIMIVRWFKKWYIERKEYFDKEEGVLICLNKR